MPPIGVEGWRNRRGAGAAPVGFREVCRARDPPLLRSWIPWEEPVNWESSPELDCVGRSERSGTVATRTSGRTGLASILEQDKSSDVLIPQSVSRQPLPWSPPISKFLKLRSTAARRLTLAITEGEEHEESMGARGLEEISEGEGELCQSGMGHSHSSRVPGLGFMGS
jgi:hypothetical protein